MLCLIAFTTLAVYLIALILVHYRRYVLTKTKIDCLEFDLRGKIKMLDEGITLTNQAMVDSNKELDGLMCDIHDKIDYAEDMLMDEIDNKINAVEERLDFAEVSISNINLKSFIKKNEERLSLLESSYAKFNEDMDNLLKSKKSKPTDSFTSPVVNIINEEKKVEEKVEEKKKRGRPAKQIVKQTKKHIKTKPTKSMVIKRMEERLTGVGVVALALKDGNRYKKEYKKAYAYLYYILNKK
jgi:ElaB/YqjD/DUF883 family membrane-anchored ribosome-binding protein